eukprot:13378282-Ditylum_brightwellii.AAC.1
MEKELLSIVETTGQHHNLLLGFKVFFHSDHKNLSFDNFKSERVRQWCLLLKDYDYNFVYTPGKDNIIANMLSCYLMQDIGVHDIAEVSTVSLADDIFPLDHRVIQSAQLADKRTNVSNPKSWTFIRFGQTPS